MRDQQDTQRQIDALQQDIEHLRQQIQLGVLQPGQKLPAERDLAQSAKVSRMTARNAMQRELTAKLVRETQDLLRRMSV